MIKTVKTCVAIASVSLITSAAAYAANPGTYLGLGLGAGKQQIANLDINEPYGIQYHQSHSKSGLAGRLFAGYNFNNYYGLEAGFTQYSTATTKINATNVVNGKVNGSVDYKMSALDLVGKGYLPITDSGFNVYGLAGLALVHSTVEAKANAIANSGASFSAQGSKTQNTVRPVVGLGASYDIPETQLTTSLEYSYTAGKGNIKTSSSAVPSAQLATFNLIYNLG